MSYLEEQLNIKEGEPHYKAAMYVKEHGLSLLDFDCWTHLEDLLGFEISYDDYCKADSTIEGDLLEVEHGDETHHAILRALNGEQPQRTTIYTVAIKDLECNEADHLDKCLLHTRGGRELQGGSGSQAGRVRHHDVASLP